MLSPERPPSIETLQMEDWSNLKASFGWIYEGPVKPFYRKSTYQYPGQSVFLLRRGTLLIRTPRGSVQAHAGQWIVPNYWNRYQEFSEDAEILSLHIDLNWPGGHPLFNLEVAAVFDANSAPEMEKQSLELLDIIQSTFSDAREFLPKAYAPLLTHIAIQRYFYLWLFTYIETLLQMGYRPSRLGQIDPRVLEAVHVLDLAPLGTRFNERDLARHSSLSSSQLARLFSKQFGLTPRAYFEKRKLERAMTSIRNAMPIKEVAFDLGFSCLPHFSGWFRKKTGVSPRLFQAQHREMPNSCN